jgi:hypothetical protein
LTVGLIAVVLVSLFAANRWFNTQRSPPEFFVGAECAYGNVTDLKSLVDKVKNYTNLFVIGSLEISFDQTALNESCDYIVNAGLNFIVLFTESQKYNYRIFVWMEGARQKYGDKFLGVYRYDEPGGNQLDQVNPNSALVSNATSYADAAAIYGKGLGIIVDYYSNYAPRLFTADYGLYWFDYEAGYNAVFAEFGWDYSSGQSRQLSIALCRGAAEAHHKDWGAIVTWTYNGTPYIESGKELYDDMTLAYGAGAKYVVIFDYPKIGQYGVLTEDHFGNMTEFWNYVQSNPQNFGATKGTVAYVLPQDYGFGFRNPGDTIWGLWNADNLSQKVWDDANKLINRYDTHLGIVYNDPELISVIRGRYERLFFWNETIA